MVLIGIFLRHEREERASGRSFPEALRIASRTSGRTILVSGGTVMAALVALFLVGAGPYAGIAAGTIAVVAIAVAGSLTVLPALLAWLGPRSDAGSAAVRAIRADHHDAGMRPAQDDSRAIRTPGSRRPATS